MGIARAPQGRPKQHPRASQRTFLETRKILLQGLQQGFKIIKIMFGHMDHNILRHLLRCFQVRCILLGYNAAMKWVTSLNSKSVWLDWADHEGGGPIVE